MYRNDDVLITDLMDRISNLENQMTELKKIYYKQSGESHSTFLYGCEVRGSDYLHLEDKIVPRLKETNPVLLIREADNKYDKNAISVTTPSGLKLGYVPHEHNLIFSRLIDAGNLLFGRVKTFHWDGKNLELVTASYEKKEQLLKEQLVVMYELGELSYLDVLLSSTSITEFITTYHLLADLTEYNTKLMDDVEEQMKIIENSKQKLENEQAELKILKSKAEQTSIILKNTKTMQQAYIAKLTDDEKKVNDEIQKYKIEAALIESQIKANSSYGTAEIQNTGGTMPWPVAMTGTQITSYYGTREHPIQGIIKLHQGIDIGNVGYGAPVIAVMDGTVTHAGELGSYGNCVMIDHGNGITTVYAHGQSVLTEKGATVKKGDVILATGSTGNSTGPHLHFEVRVNGNTVDPLLFVNEPK